MPKKKNDASLPASNAEKSAQARKTAKAPSPVIDFPQEGEIITSRHYTFRLGVPAGASGAQVSVDGKPWQAARESHGYWWLDWSDYSAGPHNAVLRIPAGASNRFLKSKPRQFTVLI